MAIRAMSEVIGQLRTLALAQQNVDATDGQLLECFVSCCEAAALEVLVRRHGPMVWGVCRRLLSHHDAEDAFQATFLVLLRKAAAIVPREMVGNWLYGVAYQAALNARARIAKQQAREVQVLQMPEPAASEDSPPRKQGDLLDWQPLLDRELSRLPDRFRVAIVLCDLEGKSRKEAASQLGLPEGTVASRLARARALLAKRLARHGLSVSSAAVASVVAQTAASASVPAAVLSATIQAVTQVATGNAVLTGVIQAQVAAITEGVLKTMFLNKLKTVTVVLLTLGLAVFGAGLLKHETSAARQSKPPAEGAKPEPPRAEPIKAEGAKPEPPKAEPARQADQSVDVRARVSGYLIKVAIKEGSLVKKGDLLFEIDPRPYQAEVDRAKALLELAEIRLKGATADFQRAKILQGMKVISQDEVDKFVNAKDEAAAQVRVARASLEIPRLNLAFTRITAPIDGRISRKPLSVGNLAVADQTALTTIVSQGKP